MANKSVELCAGQRLSWEFLPAFGLRPTVSRAFCRGGAESDEREAKTNRQPYANGHIVLSPGAAHRKKRSPQNSRMRVDARRDGYIVFGAWDLFADFGHPKLRSAPRSFSQKIQIRDFAPKNSWFLKPTNRRVFCSNYVQGVRKRLANNHKQGKNQNGAWRNQLIKTSPVLKAEKGCDLDR